MRNFIDLMIAEDVELTRDDILLEDEWEWTPDNIRREVHSHYGLVVFGPSNADLSPDHYDWSFVQNYPVSKISGDAWGDWMKDEIKMWTEEGQPDRYDSMFVEPISDPVVLVEINDVGYLWDGCHRTGAVTMQNIKSIPALVGRLRK